MIARSLAGETLAERNSAPAHAFTRRYTAADVALLAEVDRAMDTLSGPATVHVLRRGRDVFDDTRFARLGELSVAHLYNLRASPGYRQQRVVVTKTHGNKVAGAYFGPSRTPISSRSWTAFQMNADAVSS